MIRLFLCFYAFALLALTVGSASAQVQTGTPPFGSFGGGPDIINLANLNSHVDIPVIAKPGRGGFNFTYDSNYDSSVWYPVTSSGTQSWIPVVNWGWRGVTEVSTGYVSYTQTFSTVGQCHITTTTNWAYHDSFGAVHPFLGSARSIIGSNCSGNQGLTAVSTDGSGYTINTPPSGLGTGTITSRSGSLIAPPVVITSGQANATDRNGNQITVNGSGQFFDTLSSTTPVLTVTGSGTPASPTAFTYTAPSGAAASYTMKYTSYTVKTNFGCSGISDYGPTVNNLVSEIDLPDATKYTFTYEATPGFAGDVTGRLASITLPTGGTITYTYTGGSSGHITCGDGSTSGLTRATPDGSWSYARAAGTGAAYTTTVTDPQNDKTTIQFQGIYETQRQVNQGASILLQTTNTCYNVATSPCTATAITLPISQVDVYVQPVGASNLVAKHTTKYNATYDMVTETDDYDYSATPPGTLLQKTAVTYASLANNLVAFPQLVTVTRGGNIVSQTNNNYDETAVVATSGTPQHTSITGSRGNLTSVNSYTNSTTFLTSHATYFDTGTVQTATDVNGAQTTNTYGTGSCGNSFPTSVAEPLTLSKSAAWNCTGGVQTSVTDENGKVTSVGFLSAYFWRPGNVLDPTGAQTNFAYTGQNSVESTLNFNSGASTSDSLTTLDGLGRVSLSQVKQSPSGNFDTVEQDYDSLGRPSRKTLPYSGTAGQTSSTAPAASTTYDALGRPLTVADAGGGTTTYTYNQNDVSVTIGPAAVGENTKRRQLQYDSLGRLTSVCEITSVTGSGTCGQTAPQTGLWTKYAYSTSSSGPSLGVTQNAQAAAGSQQTRSYTYDLLGRLTSETNPESGASGYVYDSNATCGISSGDMVKKTDAAGVYTCVTYDALHRVKSATYSNSTPCKFFAYDTNAGIGFSGTEGNLKGRMSGAWIGTCSNGNPIGPNEGFNYSARGELLNFYQGSITGFWYDAAASYWPNGALNTLQLLNCTSNCTSGTPVETAATPKLTYNADGEGRPYQASASSGQNPVTATTYNAASLPTAVTFGSLDNDAFTYDPFTMRLTKYQFNVNSQPYSGVLTWNANGSLNGLNINDPFNSADTQTCSYQHDDLIRIANVNCSPNQLVNPGLESGNVNWSYTAEWSIVNNPANAQSGSWYLSGTSSGDTWAIATIGGSNYQPVTPGQVVQYGGWIKRVSGTGNMWYSCEVVDASHNFVAWCPVGAGIGDGTGGTTWQFYQQEFTIPAGGAYVVYHTEIHGAADPDTSLTTGYFDSTFYGAPSTWTQVFSYDPFGNITKTVPTGGTGNSFQASYSSATNHITSVAGFTPTYDGDGNVTNDSNHIYVWDSDGNASTVDAVALTYDALDRMVDQNRSGAHTQILYTPTGQKFALMSGQTLVKAFFALPGGAQATYNASGLLYYGHSDHLGSIRLGSTTTRAVSFGSAYAPFGETYATSGTTDPAFTSQRQDTSAGLYDFPAREYSTQGRWASPDPAALAAVDPTNPQSWNRYAYVLNNPLAFDDPTGLDPCQGANIFPFSQAANGTGIFDQDDCIANGGSMGGSFLGGGGPGGQTGGPSLGADTMPGCDPPNNTDSSISAAPTPNCPATGSGGPGAISAGGGSRGGVKNSGPTMRAQTDWFYSKQAMCLAAATKEFLGGLVLKNEINAAVDAVWIGDPNQIQGAITPGSVAWGAERGLEHVAENRPLIVGVRSALRQEGWKVSGNAIARKTKFLGKIAIAIHVGFALSDGSEVYDACMAN